MTEQYYELDPHGDLVLILKADSHVVHEKSNDSSNIENDEQADTSLPVTNSESLEQGEVRMRVSSKHLALASKVFKLMLKPGYLEGNKLLSQGYVELPLPDDNQAALLILMNLIHGKLKKVPRKITLEMLTELAILVDKYELLEITEVFRDCWFEDLKTSIPQEFNQDLLPWLCISWVFAETEVFRRVTMIAKMESEGTVEEYRLPIPCAVLETINKCRETTIAELLSYLQGVLKTYQGSKRICSLGVRCDGLILGSLMIEMNKMGVLQPVDFPYNGLSFKALVRKLGAMYIPQYCRETSSYYYDGPCIGVHEPLRTKIEELEQHLCGLKLSDHKFQRG